MACSALGLLLALPARASYTQTYSSGFQSGGVVPGGNLAGWADTRTVGGVLGPSTGKFSQFSGQAAPAPPEDRTRIIFPPESRPLQNIR